MVSFVAIDVYFCGVADDNSFIYVCDATSICMNEP